MFASFKSSKHLKSLRWLDALLYWISWPVKRILLAHYTIGVHMCVSAERAHEADERCDAMHRRLFGPKS